MASEPQQHDTSIPNSEVSSTDAERTGSSHPDIERAAPTLSVVLPTMNEEEGIAECLENIRQAEDEIGIDIQIIVSDSSTDRTPEIAREHGATVVKPPEEGYGNAYKYGFEHVRGEYVAIGDADTTYDFKELPKLLTPLVLEEVDIVLGSRFIGEIKPGAMPALHQYIGNPLLTAFLNKFYRAGVTDAHSGFRVIRRDALEKLDLKSGGMEFASEMIMEAAEKDLEIVEVPITYHERVGDATLESFRDGWRHMKFMLQNAPSYLFTWPSLLCGIVGGLITIAAIFGLEVQGLTFSSHTMIIASLFLFTGCQLWLLSIVSALAAEPIKSPADRLTMWVTEKFKLEHGVMLGVGLIGIGGGLAGYMIIEWLAGHVSTLFAVSSLVAYTLLIIGVQTIFSSFCLSLLNKNRI